VIVTSFIEGTSEPTLQAHVESAADLLAHIHRQAATPEYAFLRRVKSDLPPAPPVLDASLDEARIRAMLATADPPVSQEAVLLHGDFWPGNLLWNEAGEPVAIDWEDAATGDPLYDLANARLEWRLAYNATAATRFTRRYQRITGRDLTALPWWDLRAALKLCGKLGSFGLAPEIGRRWRAKLRCFVNEAIQTLGEQSDNSIAT
jgi:aminoglycoside phosphotransferase (APT) family kinase protein